MKLLECHHYNSNQWIGTDSEELYQTNLKIQPPDWYWRNHKVSYTTNSQRYRAPEWDDVDWNNSILVFGCSLVFGVGVDDNQTVCHELGRMLDADVINLGMPGGSCMGMWINTEKILNYNISPLAVVYNWPSANRVIELNDDTKNLGVGPWNIRRPDQFGNDWAIHPTQGLEYTKYALMSVRRSWQCPQIHRSWDPDLANFLQLPIPVVKVDKARDCMHHGPESCTLLATSWATELDQILIQ